MALHFPPIIIAVERERIPRERRKQGSMSSARERRKQDSMSSRCFDGEKCDTCTYQLVRPVVCWLVAIGYDRQIWNKDKPTRMCECTECQKHSVQT
jgi:hypothetical protein